MPEAKPVRVPIQVRWRDLDPLGHVNNAVYLSYFEVARIAYGLTLLGADVEMNPLTHLPRDFEFILAGVEVNYRSPALLSDNLEVAIWVSRVGRKSFRFEYRVEETRSGRLIADGCTTQVWYDYAEGTSHPVPDEVIAQMAALQGVPIERAA